MLAAPASFHPPPAAREIGPRLLQLRELRGVPAPGLVARIAELHADEASPVRKLVAE